MIGYLDPTAELCPHPQSRASCTVQVRGGRRAMQVCVRCKLAFEGLIEGWAARSVSPRQVIAELRTLGYTRRDAAYFLLQLAAGSLRRGLVQLVRARG